MAISDLQLALCSPPRGVNSVQLQGAFWDGSVPVLGATSVRSQFLDLSLETVPSPGLGLRNAFCPGHTECPALLQA